MSVRDALDQYEKYMNEYLDLYKSMLDGSGDYFTILSKVTEMETKVNELEEALNTLSEADMTPEDYKYYIEVMSRVSQKYLDLLG